MTEYISKTDAVHVARYAAKTGKDVAGYIEHLPAADVVEVVRCRECKHFHLNAWGTSNGVPLVVAHEICDFWAGGCKTNQDGYCAVGERKDGDDNETN